MEAYFQAKKGKKQSLIKIYEKRGRTGIKEIQQSKKKLRTNI
jgi:hypothetical protein